MAAQSLFLIDDDSDDKEIFIAALSEIDPSVKCDTASNGREAIEKLTGNEIDADLVLLDLNMPLMNGKEFLAEVRKRGLLKKTPVVVFTTSSDPVTMDEVKKLGAYDFITKPDSYEKLLNTVRSVLGMARA
jgi:DNA-binding NtrC family response regulator